MLDDDVTVVGIGARLKVSRVVFGCSGEGISYRLDKRDVGCMCRQVIYKEVACAVNSKREITGMCVL